MKHILLSLFVSLLTFTVAAQKATITETETMMKTYPFSDPNPIANPESLYYPYFRFEGFTDKGELRKWKTVILENEYIQVTIFPEIGGKIWGAIEKSTGKEFIYYNHVVKFRDIAMRGAWVSGGIEYNFGIIGHAPTSATPVDYTLENKPDGSVSCYLSANDYITRTNWTVEVNLPKDKAFFTTHTTWHNTSSMDQPYYQWMNAGYKAEGNLRFCYPGNHYIGHNGKSFPFPIDKQGRDLSWYKNNNFESSKSYHVMGYYNDFFGAYWNDDDFGSVHHARHDEKLGMKIFLWSQAPDGAIWENLLTDTDGQYVELQSGRLYNQPATNSAYTPFKHPSFAPQSTDEWTEYWYPVKNIKGITKASRIGAINWQRKGNELMIFFSPVQNGTTTLRLLNKDKEIASYTIQMEAMKAWSKTFSLANIPSDAQLKVIIGNNELVYSEAPEDHKINRPQTLPEDFDWNTAYGLYIQGEQWMNIKMFDKAEKDLRLCLEKEPHFIPALVRLASLMNHTGKYEEALDLTRHALSLNTYDGEANYIYGFANKSLGHMTDAKDGFSVATYSPAFRSAAYSQLAEIAIREKDYTLAIKYIEESLKNNVNNINAKLQRLICYRKTSQQDKARAGINDILKNTPLNHFARYEAYVLQPSENQKDIFTDLIRNELPQETFLEMAVWYYSHGCLDEAIELCSFTEKYPIALVLQAYLLHQKGEESKSEAVLKTVNDASVKMVFPFRPEMLKPLEWAASVQPSWKMNYYLALVYIKNGNKTKALELLNQCDDADYAPLFLTRATLKKKIDRLSDLQKAEQLETSWRVGDALVRYYMEIKDWKQANKIASKYHKKYPSNYILGLKYGRTLCETGQYAASITLLKKLTVLPNEGAYTGRSVYRDAHLYQAIQAIESKKYSKALKAIENSKKWIDNLGVGKPYEDQIDNHLENYLEAIAHPDDNIRKSLLKNIAHTRLKETTSFNSNQLLKAIALREIGEDAEAEKLVQEWNEQFPDNLVAKWCFSIYKRDIDTANKLILSRTNPDELAPWEKTVIDLNFDLLTKMTVLLTQ